ncbi:MAG: sigma-70 family RNA polymerase sigma factor [Anaerolineaceae bacterium]|nr:sigma-70 family RNA polymerase sigma factor [Anaerolineaceae bacterium]
MDSQSWPPDGELVERCRRGEGDALGMLVERHQDRLFNAAYRMVGSEEDARDIVQGAFLKAHQNLSRFRGESGFYTWVFRITMNLALSHRRKTKRLRLVVAVEDPEKVAVSGTQVGRLVDPPEAAMEAIETEQRVSEALYGLDADHRAAVVLRDIEGLDYQTISSILDVPPGTVKSRIHRARMLLREQLKDLIA